jgi:hypothetical protein
MSKNREDAVLGQLVFNSESDWYEGKIQISPTTEVTLQIPLEDFASADEAISAARTHLPTILEGLESCKAYIASDLLEIKNSDWLEDEEEALTTEQFISQLTLSAMTAQLNDAWELCFDANELFWGHQIVVWWSPTQGFFEAQTAG